jgi:peptide/nickel transport system ATP-binding protein
MIKSGEPAAAGTASAPLLSVRNLTTGFRTETGWVDVVRDVSFDLAARETLALVGESGSGKSVTSLSIMQLLEKDESRVGGQVLFEGKNLLDLPPWQMRAIRGNDIAMIFQEPMTSLNPVLKAGRQVMEALIAHRGMGEAEARAEALRLFEKVRIPAATRRLDDYPHQFSGGMRQRVMIAMALACRPKLLIADEPTTALDVTVQAQIIELIKSLQQEEGMAVLFITHDMGVVAEIADRMVVMYRGEAVETGATSEIFTAARNSYTRALLSAVPRLGSMAGHDGPQPFPLVSGDVPAAAPRIDAKPPAERPVLEVFNLVKRFPIRTGAFGRVTSRVHAVEDLSFAIRRGETLALVGESGCGKSTTGRAILGLIAPDAGTVRLNEREVRLGDRSSMRDMRRSVQMIFQDPFASLNPRQTVGEAVAEPLLVHRICDGAEARNRVQRLLDQVGLPADAIDRFPHEFSGGQRQRICIARALTLEPRLIVADEAVSALDVSIKAQIVNLMLDLQATLGISYLFISHDMAVVERISHRVAVMYMGEIVEIGPRKEIFGNPQHPYTRRLLEAVPVPDPASRNRRRPIDDAEIKSPVRALDYVAPQRRYRQISPEHMMIQP